MPGGNTTTQNQTQRESGSQAGTQSQLLQQQQQQEQTQNQAQDIGPWGASQGLLKDIITQLGGTSTAPTTAQTGALGTLQSAASGLPNFSNAATGVANNLIASDPTHSGILSDAYAGLKGTLSPYLSSSYLNPMSNPQLGGALGVLNSDITNQVNDMFAAGGRDLSPAHATALARGLAQGEAPLLANQYNTNVGTQMNAANMAYGAGGSTASGLTNLDQTALTNKVQGINVAGAIPGLALAPGQAALTAANTAYGLPFSNLGMLEQAALPIAGLGHTGTTTGTGTTAGATSGSQYGTNAGTYAGTGTMQGSQTQQQSPWANIIGGVTGGLGLLSMFSDERVKEDIAPIGMLFDDTPVYSFRYKGDPVSRVGLMAQDIEVDRPDAVTEVGPDRIKMVDYSKATERARHIGGMLSDLDLAA